ncbi:MAG: hypothetical protein ACOCXQ_04350 [Patescibacteria group bacterium]
MTKWLIKRLLQPMFLKIMAEVRKNPVVWVLILFISSPVTGSVLSGLVVLYLSPLLIILYFTLLGPWVFGY